MKFSVKPHYKAGEIYCRILSYLFFITLFLLIWIALTITNHMSAIHFEFRVGQIALGTFSAALRSWCSGISASIISMSSSISDSTTARESSSLSCGLSNLWFQCSQSSVAKMHSGFPYSSLSTGWWGILLDGSAINTWVHPPGKSCADRAGTKGELSDNLHAAALSCWQSNEDACTVSSVSEMYRMAFICLFWGWDSFFATSRF